MSHVFPVEMERSRPSSPPTLIGRLVALAQDADRVGLRSMAMGMIDLAYDVSDLERCRSITEVGGMGER